MNFAGARAPDNAAAWARDIRRTLGVASSEVARDRDAIAKGGLREFVKRAWAHVDTNPLHWNWHLDAICEHLEAVSRGEIRDLAINVPPRCSKSLVVSVLWPAWTWTFEPEHQWLVVTYDIDLARRDARRHRTLSLNEWHRARWPGVLIPDDRTASTSVSMFSNTRGGQRTSVTVRGGTMGKDADTAILDDLIDPKGARAPSGRELDEVIDFLRETLPTRYRNPSKARRVLIMQRLHERDATAELKRQGATMLVMPMRFHRAHPDCYARDPRTEDGELLDPKRFPEETVAKLETQLGPYPSAAQLGQLPAPPGGGIFREENFKLWTELPANGMQSLSVDCAFKDSETSSWVVVQAWLQSGPNYYLVDQWREHADFTRTVEMVLAAAAKYPKALTKLIEEKANGAAVINVLKPKLMGLTPINPEGGKESRAAAASPAIRSGNVFVPHPENARYADGRRGAPWVRTVFFPEVLTFPNAATDDQVDTMTQYLNHAVTNSGQWLVGMIANM